VGPNKRRHELLLQVVGLLQLEELLGELVQLADLPVAPGRVPWSGGNEGVVVMLSDDARAGR